MITVHKKGVADLMVRRGGSEVSTAVVAASWPRNTGETVQPTVHKCVVHQLDGSIEVRIHWTSQDMDLERVGIGGRVPSESMRCIRGEVRSRPGCRTSPVRYVGLGSEKRLVIQGGGDGFEVGSTLADFPSMISDKNRGAIESE